MQKSEKKNTYLGQRILITILLLLTIFSSLFLIYELNLLNSVENKIRYIIMISLLVIDFIFIIRRNIIFKKLKKGINKKRIPYIVVSMLYTIVCLAFGLGINYFYGKLSNLNKNTASYTTYLVVKSNNKVNSINEVKDFAIGMINQKDIPDGYIIPREIIKANKLEDENRIEKFNEYHSLLDALYNDDLDAVFVPNNYVDMFKSTYENIEHDTKVIFKKSKNFEKKNTDTALSSAGKDLTTPFSVLLMGVDSTDEVLNPRAAANGDTLILVTFDPKTLNATMLSIPRDSYVPIACWSGKPKNKITHAASYGDKCMINTIQGFTGVNIDYYAKINFKGFTKLVDVLGGVEIDVKQKLCTDNSNREKVVCVNPGKQTLDGEHALVYARNRKQLADGDFGRNLHQQEVILALVDKIKTVRDVSTFNNILTTVSNSLDTNLTPSQMLSFYSVLKDVINSGSSDKAKLINIEQLKIVGDGQLIYDERARMKLWNFLPNPNSVSDCRKAMRQNLGLDEKDNISGFEFSISTPFEKKIVGSGPYRSTGRYNLLPSFIGLTKEEAKVRANKYGVSVTFTGEDGSVVSQSYPEGKRIDLISGSVSLELSIKEKKPDKIKDKVKDKDKEENNSSNSSNSSSNTGSNENNNSSTENNNTNNSADNNSSTTTTP